MACNNQIGSIDSSEFGPGSTGVIETCGSGGRLCADCSAGPDRSALCADLPTWMHANAPLEIRDDVAACFSSRGRRRGRILASVPSQKGPRVVGAWRALMSALAPTRAGMFSMLWADDEERESFERVDAWLESDRPARALLTLAGQGFCEFNLIAMRTDPERAREFAREHGLAAAALNLGDR